MEAIHSGRFPTTKSHAMGVHPVAESFDPYYRWLGIPPQEQPANHYRLLGITPFEADPEVISNAADQRMAHLRQFQAGPRGAFSQQLLNEVAAAKICLLKPEKKAEYDGKLRADLAASPTPEMAVAQPPPVPSADRRKPPPLGGRAVPLPRAAVSEDVLTLVLVEDSPARRRMSLAVPLACAGGVVLVAAAVVAATLLGRSGESDRVAAQLPADSQRSQAQGEESRSESRPPDEAAPPPEAKPTPPHELTRPIRPKRPKPAPHVLPGPQPKPAEPPQPSPAPAPPVEKPPPTAPPSPAKKQPVPAATAQKEIAGHVEDLFKVSAARPPSESLELAAQLLQEAAKPSVSADERYVLLRTVADLGVQGGDARLVCHAVEQIVAAFEVDALAARHDALLTFSDQAGDSVRRKSFVEAALAAIDGAASAGRHELALDLAAKAQEFCQQTPTIEYRGAVAAWHGELTQIAPRKALLQKALETLKTTPDDPAANLAAGTWHCFATGDWALGVSHLAKGSDEKLRKLASQETSPATDGAARANLGDAWWDLASAASEPEARWYTARAAHWYLQALKDASGLTKAKLLKRLGDVAGRLRETGPEARLAVAIHQALLGDPGLDDAGRKALQDKLARWERLASLRLGAWEPGRSPSAPKPSGPSPTLDDLLRGAAGLIAAGNLEAARDKLTEAVRANPDDIRASFAIGLVAALREHDADAAEKRFADCVRRQPEHVPSLNNLALTRVRLKRYRLAVRDWEAALRLVPNCDDVVHNLGRCQALHDKKRFMLDSSTLKALGEVRKLGADQGAASYQRGTGWHYMSFSPDVGQVSGWPQGASLQDLACSVCNGRAQVACPNRGCRGGNIKELRTRVVGRNPVNGAQITETFPVSVPCPVCRGRGQVDCQTCNGGVDRD